MATVLSPDRLAMGLLVVAVLMVVAMLVGGPPGQILFSYTIIGFFGLYVLLGVSGSAKRHSARPFLYTVAGLVAILAVVFAALWYFHFLNPSYENPVYWLGFPRATAIVVYALWMPPALFLMFAYPYLFDDYIWAPDEAEEFEEMERSEVAPAPVGGEE
ncbi:MAG: hypothetical protein ACOCUA_02420 [archaeon]